MPALAVAARQTGTELLANPTRAEVEDSGVRRVSLLLIAVAALALVSSARAAPATDVDVKLVPAFRLLDGGESIVGRARITCPAGTNVLEALAFGSQGTDPGALYAEGFVAGGTCDGRPSWWTVRVFALDGTWQLGEAFVSAFVLVIDDSEETMDGGDSVRIHVVR